MNIKQRIEDHIDRYLENKKENVVAELDKFIENDSFFSLKVTSVDVDMVEIAESHATADVLITNDDQEETTFIINTNNCRQAILFFTILSGELEKIEKYYLDQKLGRDSEKSVGQK